MPIVKDSVSWHDVIPTKRSLCQKNTVLQHLGVTAAMPMVFGSTLTLLTFISFLCFFQALRRFYI